MKAWNSLQIQYDGRGEVGCARTPKAGGESAEMLISMEFGKNWSLP